MKILRVLCCWLQALMFGRVTSKDRDSVRAIAEETNGIWTVWFVDAPVVKMTASDPIGAIQKLIETFDAYDFDSKAMRQTTYAEHRIEFDLPLNRPRHR